MSVSVFDIFKVGVGPSSSHTMGPMTAARRFVQGLRTKGGLSRIRRIRTTLYGSLGMTGRGHATDRAVIMGLAGLEPATLDLDQGEQVIAEVRQSGALALAGEHRIAFSEATDIIWEGHAVLPQHPNALKFEGVDADGAILEECVFFSVGGGFVLDEQEFYQSGGVTGLDESVPYPFGSAAVLLKMANEAGESLAGIALANERAKRPEPDVFAYLDQIVEAMFACIERGMRMEGVLPGGLNVQRRAKQVWERLQRESDSRRADPLAPLDWVNLWALAVNEENAAGGRVVTAPTNGAAGLLPAVLRYYDRFHCGTRDGHRTFLLSAAAIGSLYKMLGSISGAEVGCQGEVGVACSMAAAGFAAALGATNAQVENAAEIAMEHNLGLTCDPIGGLVQIPCIERNAMGAVKAIDAARLALLGDGAHSVSLDKVIATMKRTGEDMSHIYKETSLGGLAVNLAEC